MDSKSLMWIVVALVAAFVLFGDDKKRAASYRYSPGNAGPYPVPGPSPLGTSWAQQGPYAPATAQTNGWDVAKEGISILPGLFGAFGGSGGGGGDEGYSIDYTESDTVLGSDWTS